jgi:hypothetical protein
MLRARRETLALDDVHEPSGDGLALADAVELGEDLREMLGDIARLPDDQRAALVLAELGDLSQQEIAATLDVRTDKVKALIFQAREALAGWRQARHVSCVEICEQLSTLKGSALRRAPIRRHLALCPACTTFEAEVKHQRAALSLLLPVVPSAALKHSVLTAALTAGQGGALAAGTAAGASALTVKALVAAALAVGAGGGGVVAVRELEQSRPVQRPATTRAPLAAAVVDPPAGERRLGIPVASQRHAATIHSTGHKTEHGRVRGRPKARDIHGRGRQRAAARSAPGRQPSVARGTPGRQRSAARSVPGRQRSAAARPPQGTTPPQAAKTFAVPATPRRPLAAKPPTAKREATPPSSMHGKAG